jgi:hypothetical protein
LRPVFAGRLAFQGSGCQPTANPTGRVGMSGGVPASAHRRSASTWPGRFGMASDAKAV